MLRWLAFIMSLSFATAVLAFAPGIPQPERAREMTADPQVAGRPTILDCILPGAAAEERPISPAARCIERAHGDIRIDRIAIPEC